MTGHTGYMISKTTLYIPGFTKELSYVSEGIIILYNVCAVPWGLVVLWGIQYRGDIMSTVWDILSTVRVFNTMGDIMINVGDIMINVGDIMINVGDIMINVEDIMSTMGLFSTMGVILSTIGGIS